MSDTTKDHSAGAAPGRALTVADPSAGDRKTIVVNGREHSFAGDEIGQGELARLAFPMVGVAGESALTVA